MSREVGATRSAFVVRVAPTLAVLAAVGGLLNSGGVAAAAPGFVLQPAQGPPFTQVSFTGTSFCPSCGSVSITFAGQVVAPDVAVAADGSFQGQFEVPATAAGSQRVVATQAGSGISVTALFFVSPSVPPPSTPPPPAPTSAESTPTPGAPELPSETVPPPSTSPGVTQAPGTPGTPGTPGAPMSPGATAPAPATVGRPSPSASIAPTPPSAGGQSGGGSTWWPWVIVAVVAAALAGAGGLVILRRFRGR